MEKPRPFLDNADLQSMLELASRRPGHNLHFIDLPYRLSSWALDDPDNTRLWHDENGGLFAWAVLQTPFWSIDICVRPGAGEPSFLEVLTWAEERILRIAGSRFGRPAWYVNVFDYQQACRASLEKAGFTDQSKAVENPWSILWLKRDNTPPSNQPKLPEGYLLRPLAGESEAGAYGSLHRLVFGSDNMTEAWRRRTIAHPAYHPELDLVVEAPDGSLAGFCILWFLEDDRLPNPMGQIEPMGVHPDHRGRGIAKSLLQEGFKRLQSFGAREIFVETDNYRDAALSLYKSVGFRVKDRVLVYRKDYG